MATSSTGVLQDELTCCICHEYFTKPKTLPCMHTFCAECLEKAISLAVKPSPQDDQEQQIACNSATPSSQVLCPTCREPAQLPDGGVYKLRTNYAIANLVEAIVRYCQNCTMREIACNHCTDCNAYLCDFCSKYHTRAVEYKGHTLIPQPVAAPSPTSSLTMLNPQVQQPFEVCELHNDPLRMYCSKCMEVICTICQSISHTSCSGFIKYIDKELIASEKESLKTDLESLTSNSGDMGQHCEELTQIIKEIEEKKDGILKRVQNASATFTERVEKSTSELVTTVTSIYNDKSSPLEDQLKRVQSIRGRAEEIIKADLEPLNSIKKLIETKKEAQKLLGDCSETLQYKIDPAIPHVEFQPSKLLNDPVLNAGHLKEDIESYVAIEPPSTVHQSERQSLILQAMGKDGSNITYGSAAIHPQITHTHEPSTFLPYEVVDKTCGKYEIKYTPTCHTPISISLAPVYDIVLPVTRNYAPLVPLPSSYELTSAPYGISYLPNNQLAVTLQEKKVVILDASTGDKKGEIYSNFVRPYLMAVNGENLWITDREAHNIHCYSLSNYQKTAHFGTRGNQLGQFLHPRGIAIHPTNRNLYISDMKNNRIQVLKQESGSLVPLTSFGREGKGMCEFDQPAGLIFNHENKLVVCDDRNGRLQVLTDEGRYITSYGVTLGQKGVLCSPIGISQDPHGRYAIGEFGSHLVTVLDTEGKVLSCTRSLGGNVGSLLHPRGVAIDMSNNIYVADYGNRRIVKI